MTLLRPRGSAGSASHLLAAKAENLGSCGAMVFKWCHYRRPEAVSFWNLQSRSPLPYMPRYHFDVIGKNTIADRTGLLLPDDIHASDAADRLASELYEIRPELRVRECAVLVTDDDGEEVHRAPIVKVH
jgi:hypothetical protein